jgi:hypothetical protein
MATPASGSLIGTPASINDRVLRDNAHQVDSVRAVHFGYQRMSRESPLGRLHRFSAVRSARARSRAGLGRASAGLTHAVGREIVMMHVAFVSSTPSVQDFCFR